MTLRVRGMLLPDGVERDVFITDGRITFEAITDARTAAGEGYILPGLTDVHAHLAMASPAPPGSDIDTVVRASARAHLAAGVLAVREPGSPVRNAQGLGPDEGFPRIQTAGRFLAPPGGYFPGLARAASPEDLPALAEEEARTSGAWAKVIGEYVIDGRWSTHYPEKVLAEATERVHAAGARIAVHAMIPSTIEAAISAGVDSIEHGMTMRPDYIPEMASRGIAWVPTLTIRHDAPQAFAGAGLDPHDVHALTTEIEDVFPGRVRQAYEAGVRVLAGTDAGMVPHGRVVDEIGNLIDAGLPVEAAVAAGSWDARAFLGFPGVVEGAPADLIVVAEDPRVVPSTLESPVLVVLAGALVDIAREA